MKLEHIYNKFKCTANNCKLTCCTGWNISVDEATYKKWEAEELQYILQQVKKKKTGYYIKKRTEKTCPLLDDKGLCKVVKDKGEEYLSLTCHEFPRIHNFFEGKNEYSLSCTCPEVVNLISEAENKLELELKNNIRDKIIYSFQKSQMPIECKFIETLKFLGENKKVYKEEQKDLEEALNNVNDLFLDMLINYNRIEAFELVFRDIYEFAEKLEVHEQLEIWETFKSELSTWNTFTENCIAIKIYSNCVDSDIVTSFKLIIIEFLLIRHALFLKYCILKEVKLEDIKVLISTLSRIIENNSEAVLDYFMDETGDYIWDLEYLEYVVLI